MRFFHLHHAGNGLVFPELSAVANMPLQHNDVVGVDDEDLADRLAEHPLMTEVEGPATNTRELAVEDAPKDADEAKAEAEAEEQAKADAKAADEAAIAALADGSGASSVTSPVPSETPVAHGPLTVADGAVVVTEAPQAADAADTKE